jgi:ABC-type molybdenum transport system ATPase subunit/photorepair protein PhrA
MDRLKLFEFIQGENEERKILDQLKWHVNEGKKLEWVSN